MKLSVLIPCFNSGKTIRATLESVQWADEILAVDSFSTDKTLDILREYKARVLQHEYLNSAKQKNWAIPQCSHEWILIVDTDEVLEPGLKEEIETQLKKMDLTIQAYKIPRKNFVYGEWMKYSGFYPDYQTRLFRKGKAVYQDREVHAHMEVEGKTGVLKHHFLHNGFKGLQDWFLKTERYVRYEADELIKNKRSFSYTRLLIYPPVIFLRNYFIHLGFLEGYRGLLLAMLDSFYYFLVYAKLYELKRVDK